MDCSPPGSSVCGILQARILEWVATTVSRGSSWLRDQTVFPALQADSLPLSHQGRLARSALTKYHRLRVLNNRNTFLKVLETKKFKIKALERLASFWGVFSWLVDRPPSCYVFTWPLLCAHAWKAREKKGGKRREEGGEKENTHTHTHKHNSTQDVSYKNTSPN